VTGARKLAAILAADIVGFSRLAGADEERTLARLRALRSDLLDPVIAVNEGRVVKRTGDGAIVEFRSVVNAVKSAVEIQTAMAERNAGVPESRRIVFRIGVHIGDVVEEEDGDLMGDGVNIAARLESVAKPGAICLSEDAYRQVKARLDVKASDLGPTRLKNIAEPIRAYLVEIDNSPSAPTTSPDAPPLPDRPSIAVLPFQNMSGDPDQEYFVDGMVEDIITGLSRIKWLFVIARNSSFIYKGRPVDVRQAGRDLGVRYILEGSVRKAGNRLRVTGQVLEAETGRHIWAERYDRLVEDVFAVQDELTTSVLAAIEPNVRQAEVERVKRKRPESLDAYDLVLRALPDLYPGRPEHAIKALPLLERALDLEPHYAMAHGCAAWCHEILFLRSGAGDDNRIRGIRHALAAIEYGRDDAMAQALGGFVIGMVGHDRETARRAFETAIALSPSCIFAYIFGSIVMATGGDADRGIEWGERAIRLSPFDSLNMGSYLAIAFGRIQRGEYRQAAEAARTCYQANPNWSYAHMLLAATHAKLGRANDAAAAAKRVTELEPGFSISGMCRSAGLPPAIAEPLSEALKEAGLPP